MRGNSLYTFAPNTRVFEIVKQRDSRAVFAPMLSPVGATPLGRASLVFVREAGLLALVLALLRKQ